MEYIKLQSIIQPGIQLRSEIKNVSAVLNKILSQTLSETVCN